MRTFIYVKRDGSGASKPGNLTELMRQAEKRVVKGDGLYTITVNGEQVGQEHKRSDVLAILHRRLNIGKVGSTYRVRNPQDVVFTCREVKLAPETINTSGNDKSDKYWTALKVEFPTVTFLGSYVCKADSQHRYGNAVDGGFSSPKMGEEMFQWAIHHAAEYDIRNVIVQTKIWHLGDTLPYNGVAHVTHTHVDFDPTYSYTLPCGVLPRNDA